MKQPQPLPEDLAGRAFTRGQAEQAGVPPGRLRRRDVRRPFHGVQVLRSTDTLEQRAAAYLVRLRPGQAYSHPTAVLLHGLPLPRAFEEELDLHVSALWPARAPTARGVAGHRIRIPAAVVTVRGMPVVAMEEAWAQMAPLLTLDELIELGDAILWRDPSLLPALRAVAETPFRPQRERLLKALREIRPGCASPGETRVRLLLTRAGLPEPELNAPVEIPGALVHPDLVWRARRVAVEYEGDGHREQGQFRADVERYELLQSVGWTVVRVTADDLRADRAARLVARVRALLS